MLLLTATQMHINLTSITSVILGNLQQNGAAKNKNADWVFMLLKCLMLIFFLA